MSRLIEGCPTGRASVAAAPATTPLTLAHRGSPGPGRPENTVAAVAAALTDGSDGIEVDIRLTADGRLVCSHDADLAGIAGAALPVATSTAAALRRVPLPGGHTAAMLEDVLRAAAAHGRRRVIVEVKAPADSCASQQIAPILAGVLRDYDTTLDVVVSCFDWPLLDEVRSAVADVDVRTALLGAPFAPAADLLRRAVVDGHDEIHLNVSSVLRSSAVVEAARMLGIGVTCWTVNDARQVQRLAALGVDALITDNPSGVRAALHLTVPTTMNISA